MSVFITGGFGHIASWATYYLVKEGTHVIIYDSQAGIPDHLKRFTDQITFVQGDILDNDYLSYVFHKYHNLIEGIIHTISILGDNVRLDSHKNTAINVMGTLNILELARFHNINKVVFTSSGAVYDPNVTIANEDSPLVPNDLYGASKISSEYLGIELAKLHKLDFRIARLFFVYGPGKFPSESQQLYKFVFGALEGKDNLRINSNGNQKYDFTYVADAARGLVLLYKAKNLNNRIYNISSGEAYSVKDVLAMTNKACHSKNTAVFGMDNPRQRCEILDISRAKADLGYVPEYSISSGIQLYYEWLKQIKLEDKKN